MTQLEFTREDVGILITALGVLNRSIKATLKSDALPFTPESRESLRSIAESTIELSERISAAGGLSSDDLVEAARKHYSTIFTKES